MALLDGFSRPRPTSHGYMGLWLRSQFEKYFQEKSYTGQETYKRDVKHNIKRDEHVDTAVQNFEYGDTEVRLKGSESAK